MATQTGSAEEVAKDALELFQSSGFTPIFHDLADDDDISFLTEATLIIGVVSTWGEGEPPDDAEPFFEKLRRSPPLNLKDTSIAIFGLGDSGYDIFCGCGKELERELIRHGGESIIPRVDCDTWYDEELEKWLSDLQKILLPAEVGG